MCSVVFVVCCGSSVLCEEVIICSEESCGVYLSNCVQCGNLKRGRLGPIWVVVPQKTKKVPLKILNRQEFHYQKFFTKRLPSAVRAW